MFYFIFPYLKIYLFFNNYKGGIIISHTCFIQKQDVNEKTLDRTLSFSTSFIIISIKNKNYVFSTFNCAMKMKIIQVRGQILYFFIRILSK